jgi:hypothetical protein
MNAAAARLSSLTKELRIKWQLTRESWTDARAQEFDARYMQELFATVDRSMEVITEMEKLLTRIRKECE